MPQLGCKKPRVSLALRGRKLSEKTKGRIGSTIRKLGIKPPLWPRGKKHTAEARRKMSKMAKLNGNGRWIRDKERSPEYRKNISMSKLGRKHWNWKGGITKLRVKIWHSQEYKLWRKSVFERDSYTCVFCGKTGGELNADHVKPFALFPELRFAIDNGRTLCTTCHIKTETYGGKIIKFKLR